MANSPLEELHKALNTFPGILRQITSPEPLLGLALLTVLVFSIVIAITGAEAIILPFVGLVALILLIALLSLFKEKGKRLAADAPPDHAIQYDAYIAAPMEGLILPDSGEDYDIAAEERYRNLNQQIKRVKDALRTKCKIKTILYAGLDIDGPAKFDQPYIALENAITILLASRKFILIYPKRISSSIIFEAGLALAYGKQSVWFVRDRRQLPYLMREAHEASDQEGRRLVRILEYKDFDDLVRSFEINGERLFEMPDKN